MANPITAEEGILTVSDLVYKLRDSIGFLKDRIIEGIDGNINQDTSLAGIVKKGHLNQAQKNILSCLDLITEDPHYQSLPQEEKSEVDEKVLDLKQSAVKLTMTGDLGTKVKEVPHLNELAKFVYEKLDIKSEEDHLTGLPTFYIFKLLADQKVADYIEDPTQNLTLVQLDLSRMDEMNNTTSYEQTDIVLKKFAQGLKETVGAVKCRRSGDEFYLLLKGPDAEGAKAILETRLISYVENELPKLVREQAVETLGEYDATFEDTGNKVSIGIGITSTQLPKSPNFYQRLAKYIKKWYKSNRDKIPNVDFDDIARKATQAEKSDDPNIKPGNVINQELKSPENRTVFRNLFYQMLIDEAKDALHAAKNQMLEEPNKCKSFIYDPSKKKNTYIYRK